MKRNTLFVIVMVLLLGNFCTGYGQQEIGHFAPGVLSIRDFIMPEPGFYGALYTYRYTTDQVNDAEGNQIKTITINPGPGPGAVIDLDVDVNVGVIAPTLIWVSKWKVLGSKIWRVISRRLSATRA